MGSEMCIRDRGIEDGLKPVLMGLAAQKSSQEHRPVRISEIMSEEGL